MNMETTEIQSMDMNALRQVQSQATDKDLAFAVELGKIQALDSIVTISKTTIVQWFKARKESKDYKNVRLIGKDNKSFVASTFEELCEGLGYSHSVIYEELKSFESLGGKLFSATQELGLSRAKMRGLRSALSDMGEDEREIAVNQIENGDKEDLRDWINDLLVEKNQLKNDVAQALAKQEKDKKNLEKADKEAILLRRELQELKNPSPELKVTREQEDLLMYENYFKQKMEVFVGSASALVSAYHQYVRHAMSMEKEFIAIEANADISNACVKIANVFQTNDVDIDFTAFFNDGFDFEAGAAEAFEKDFDYDGLVPEEFKKA